MTVSKAEVWNLIQHLPEENLGQVVTFIENMNATIDTQGEDRMSERRKAFARLDHLNINVPKDFDYRKEMESMRDEKYGYLN